MTEHRETSEADQGFAGLRAVFFNCTLKRSPELSHTSGLVELSAGLMREQGVEVEVIRSIDHPIATGVYPDMTEHGWEQDAWPELFELVKAADILVIAGPIWLGDNSSVTKQVIERLYAMSGMTNDAGQYIYYGKVGGALVTGNEDGVKHCAMNILYSLQHIGVTIPPAADAGWIGPIGPGPSYLDPGSGGPESDFTNRNTTFMAWNLMHMAKLLHQAGGIPAWGNVPEQWDSGQDLGLWPNPEYR
ncbi:flavodoxin family protein [Nesterenkonia sp. E16_7]|uniref:flavodoxin family protein n=1 Tax=unclassified Nesterenkonia TaxID=2629769 RepID=UPI001A939325|nr:MULTISPECIES: flavodoxin family protein [unclassified Nesterenkonia]MBO0594974.1 flavodoxin family protein [Nesterenkonia sp. E16_10]MBO0598629.1 flavodoxin family protein [Nesterenkonia sp. E16_7]